jgi:hypothetical protein
VCVYVYVCFVYVCVCLCMCVCQSWTEDGAGAGAAADRDARVDVALLVCANVHIREHGFKRRQILRTTPKQLACQPHTAPLSVPWHTRRHTRIVCVCVYVWACVGNKAADTHSQRARAVAGSPAWPARAGAGSGRVAECTRAGPAPPPAANSPITHTHTHT